MIDENYHNRLLIDIKSAKLQMILIKEHLITIDRRLEILFS
jgi:hypothetical protein